MKKPTTLGLALSLTKGLGFRRVERVSENAVSFQHSSGVEVLARPSLVRVYSKRAPTKAQLKSLKLEAAPARETKQRAAQPKFSFGLVVTEDNTEAVRALIESLITKAETP
jgi:hypothetical protein